MSLLNSCLYFFLLSVKIKSSIIRIYIISVREESNNPGRLTEMFKFFMMNTEEYKNSIICYAEKFHLRMRWTISTVHSFPDNLRLNYSAEKAVACTNWGDKTVLFKSKLLKMPKFLARAYIRHEIRHCAQMEVIYTKMKEKYGDLAEIYTSMIIVSDNQNGYGKSLMEADAWLAFFGVCMDINKVADKIIKRNWFC